MNNKIKIVTGLLIVLVCVVLGINGLNAREPELTFSDSDVELENAILVETEKVEVEPEGILSTDESIVETDTIKKENAAIVVHVCGAVVSPGVYMLDGGSRVYEAIDAAGGFSEDAAKDYLNQADMVPDGSRLYVPSIAEITEDVEHAANTLPETYGVKAPDNIANSSNSTKVNLNTATKEELMSLRGVGESKANAIIEYRTSVGPFRTIEDVMNITGIKEGMFNKIKDNITV